MKHTTSIEALESRIAPAAVFALSGSVLKITGDANNDTVKVSYSGTVSNTNHILTITGASSGSGSTNGNGIFTISETSAIKSIVINLGNGSNDVTFSNDDGDNFIASISYTGGVAADTLHFEDFNSDAGMMAKLGLGDDVVNFRESTVGVAINTVGFAKDVSIDLGGGNNQITTTASGAGTHAPSLEFHGALTITGGNGSDAINLGVDLSSVIGFMNTNVLVGKTLTFNGGKGANDFNVFGTDITLGKTTLKSADLLAGFTPSIIGSASATITAGSLTVAAPANATNSFDLEAPTIKVSGGISYAGGAAADTVNIGTVSGSLSTIIAGKIGVTNGAGTNITKIGSLATPGTLFVTGALALTGGIGSDTLAIHSTSGSISGGVSTTLGAGASNVSVAGSGLIIAGLTVKTSGVGSAADTLTLSGLISTKAISATLGAGAATVKIDDIIALDKFTLNTGAGGSTINIETDAAFTGASTFFKAANIISGIGADALTIGSATSVTFLSSLTAKLGLLEVNGTNTSNITGTFLPGFSSVVTGNN